MSDLKNTAKIIQLGISDSKPLAQDLVHLYVIDMTTLQEMTGDLGAILNSEEQARAERFVNPKHGQHYRCVRGVLRRILSRYLNIAPQAVNFAYAAHGKPLLQNDPALHFNLSHSHHMAAYAIRLEQEIGVDIEFMRPQKNLVGMIKHVASPLEQDELNMLTENDARQAFYRLWTRKEAFIKAVGRGLGMGLRSIHIGTQLCDASLAVAYKNQILPDWYIQDIHAPTGYQLAVCSKY